MTILALHDVNGQYLVGEMDRIIESGVGHTVVLHHWRERCRAFHERGVKTHLRFDFRGALNDPTGDARIAGDDLVGIAQYVSSARARNEPQLESPGATPPQWYEYLVTFGRAWRQVGPPGVALFVPAISPGVGSDGELRDWLMASASAGKVGGFDGLDAHAYGTPAQIAAWLGRVRRHWDGRLIVSETNPGAGQAFSVEQWAADVPAIEQAGRDVGAEAVVLYTSRWVSPDMDLPTSVDVLGGLVEVALRQAARRNPVAAPGPKVDQGKTWEGETMPDQWAVGPGVAAKMREHGDKPVSNEQYVGSEMSVAFGEKGVYIYSKQANRTYFLPAA